MNMFKKHAYMFMFLGISVILAVVTCFLNHFGLITNGMNALPHIITFSTVILGITGLVFTIVVNIKDGAFYKSSQENSPEAIERVMRQVLGCLKASTWASIFLILVSIAALTISKELCVVKVMFVFLVSFGFYFLIITTAQMLQLSFQLLSHDSRAKN